MLTTYKNISILNKALNDKIKKNVFLILLNEISFTCFVLISSHNNTLSDCLGLNLPK